MRFIIANKFTLKTELAIYIQFLMDSGACKDTGAIDFYIKELKKKPNMTFEEGINLIEDESWAVFCLIQSHWAIDDHVKRAFIERILFPMSALLVYLKIPESDLSKEINDLLTSKFKGKLPKAEKELENGEVLRVS